MTETHLKSLIGKNIKVFYNDLSTKVTIDVGKLINFDNGFLIVQTRDKVKWISKFKVVRLESETSNSQTKINDYYDNDKN